MKRFGDLKKGDNVFLVMLGPAIWRIGTLKILKVKSGINDTELTVDVANWSGYYLKDCISSRADTVWSDREEALRFALEKTKKERDYLSNKIDEMISKYDKIEKFIDSYDK